MDRIRWKKRLRVVCILDPAKNWQGRCVMRWRDALTRVERLSGLWLILEHEAV